MIIKNKKESEAGRIWSESMNPYDAGDLINFTLKTISDESNAYIRLQQLKDILITIFKQGL
jgi:hypothetical protein